MATICHPALDAGSPQVRRMTFRAKTRSAKPRGPRVKRGVTAYEKAGNRDAMNSNLF